jgi:hypothetical protein
VQHLAYFLIEPKQIAVLELPQRVGKESAELMLEPYLTTRCFADRSAWRQFEVVLAVKLMHLAKLREYDPLRTDAAAHFILGSDRVSAAVFDQWWTIRKLNFKGPSENRQELLSRFFDKIDLTGNALIDYWIRKQHQSAQT